jgi:hypothetical protein
VTLPGNFLFVSVGGFAACGVTTSGSIACAQISYASPPIPGTFSRVSVGDLHACALRTDGVAVCWGNTDFSQSDGCTAAIDCTWIAGP